MHPAEFGELQPAFGGSRILRKREVIRRVGYSLVHIYRLEKQGAFPKRVKLGPNSVGWIESEIEAWIRERIRRRDQLR
jgi:prophage regulatory protein